MNPLGNPSASIPELTADLDLFYEIPWHKVSLIEEKSMKSSVEILFQFELSLSLMVSHPSRIPLIPHASLTHPSRIPLIPQRHQT